MKMKVYKRPDGADREQPFKNKRFSANIGKPSMPGTAVEGVTVGIKPPGFDERQAAQKRLRARKIKIKNPRSNAANQSPYA